MSAQAPSVLVTGASSGIGRATALHLASLGFDVFAGVRKESDAESLRKDPGGNLRPIFLDVTDPESIRTAKAHLAAGSGGDLSALVNNAGISLNGPLEMLPYSEIRSLFEVNLLGLLAVTKAFVPELRTAGGRIINISSGHGLLAVPDKSVYAASKAAVEAITDSLRLELRPFGVFVASIVVGKVETPVQGKIEAARQRMIDGADPRIATLYRPLFDFFDTTVSKLPGIPAEEVARIVGTALQVRKPKARYLVGPGARKMRNLGLLPRRIRDRLMAQAIYGRGRT